MKARKKYKCSILICTFLSYYYSIFYHAALKYSSRIKSISITFDTSLNMISLRKRKETATLKSQSRRFIRACQMTAVRRLFFCRRTADNYFLFLIEKEFL